MKFEWDDKKRHSNIRKHGIDFNEVYEIFTNPLLIKLDTRIDYGEDRYVGLGITNRCVVVIAYTEPKATKIEQKIYEKYLKKRLGQSQ